MYQTEYQGKHHELGTSGFLYRSSKLMYDADTMSLWSTLQGKPVIGPMVEQGINLQRHYVVTTTWKQWRRQHPGTTVLSIETGFQRDYGEGVAYRDYFASDKLMFEVPSLDDRLEIKDQVLALRTTDQGVDEQLAISAAFLEQHSVYNDQLGHDQLGQSGIVVLTDASGANRVYASGDVRFDTWDGQREAVDQQGRKWTVDEASLKFEQLVLPRVPAHRAFWFGWFAQFPETRLVK